MAKQTGTLQDTMLFVANGGKAPTEQQPPPNHAKITAKATALKDGEVDTDSPLWSWKFDSDSPAKVTDLSCNTPMMAGMKVCEQVHWECVSITFGGSQRDLPLTPRFLQKIYSLAKGSIAADASQYWKLEAKLDASYLLVFGYEFVTFKGGAPVPLTKNALSRADLMGDITSAVKSLSADVPLNAKNSFTLTPRRVIVCLSLACCKLRYDFDPGGALGAARFYPHLMVMTNFDLDSTKGECIDATLHMQPGQQDLSCDAGHEHRHPRHRVH